MANRMMALLAGCAMMAASGAQAHCTSTADESAFDVAALKSELSVLAVACEDDKEYNAFIERARPVLVREDGVVNAWFKRTYGRSAQSKYDSYITVQANEQSASAQHEGSEFCAHRKVVFAEAMAVPLPSLAEYAAAKDLMPVDLACVNVTAAPTPSRGSSHPATKRASTKK